MMLRYLLLFGTFLCLFILGINSAPEHEFLEDSRVIWVPVMERRNEMAAAIQGTLKTEAEKTQRISKMLNKSISTQEEEVAQGSKKLHVLQKTTAIKPTPSNSAESTAKSFKFLLILPICLLNFGQMFIKALI